MSSRTSSLFASVPLFSLIIGLVAGALALFPELGAAIDLRRTALFAGEWWRIFGGHLTHWSSNHLLWDVGTFVCLAALYESPLASLGTRSSDVGQSRLELVLATFIAMIAISLAVLILQPQITVYRGLSGLCVMVFAMLATRYCIDAIQTADREALYFSAIALILMVAKVSYEALSGQTLFADSATDNYVVLPIAHAVGALVGITVVIIEKVIRNISFLPSTNAATL